MKLGFCTMGYLSYTELDEAIQRTANIGYDGNMTVQVNTGYLIDIDAWPKSPWST